MTDEVAGVETKNDEKGDHEDAVKIFVVDVGGDVAAEISAGDGCDHHERQHHGIDVSKMGGPAHGCDVGALSGDDDTQRGEGGAFAGHGEQDDEDGTVEDAAADAEKGGDGAEDDADGGHERHAFDVIMRQAFFEDFVQHDQEHDEDLADALHDDDLRIVGGGDEIFEHELSKHAADHAADGEEGDDAPVDAPGVFAGFDDADDGHCQDGYACHVVDGGC